MRSVGCLSPKYVDRFVNADQGAVVHGRSGPGSLGALPTPHRYRTATAGTLRFFPAAFILSALCRRGVTAQQHAGESNVRRKGGESQTRPARSRAASGRAACTAAAGADIRMRRQDGWATEWRLEGGARARVQ